MRFAEPYNIKIVICTFPDLHSQKATKTCWCVLSEKSSVSNQPITPQTVWKCISFICVNCDKKTHKMCYIEVFVIFHVGLMSESVA